MDTNVVIDFLGGRLPNTAMVQIQTIADNNEQALSIISKIELLAYNGSPKEMQELNDFINASHLFRLPDDIVDKTIELRLAHRRKLPDLIIAATTIVFNLTLLTHNTRDFNNISGLIVVDPHTI